MRMTVDISLDLVSPGRVFPLRVAFGADGGCTVLSGPSGAGKSATLRCLAGMLRPGHGRIVLGERELFDSLRGVDLPVRERGLGFVFQDYALFPHLSAAENVAFGLRAHWPRPLDAAARERVAELLEFFELGPAAACRPRDLSGGQRQRLAIARALAPTPRALLLDEPFAALDQALRAKLRAELRRVQRRWDVPIVLVTHDPEDIAFLADTVVECRDGRVAAVETRSRPHGASRACLPFPARTGLSGAAGAWRA